MCGNKWILWHIFAKGENNENDKSEWYVIDHLSIITYIDSCHLVTLVTIDMSSAGREMRINTTHALGLINYRVLKINLQGLWLVTNQCSDLNINLKDLILSYKPLELNQKYLKKNESFGFKAKS